MSINEANDPSSDKDFRCSNGHYRKGHSGNLAGRPPKPKRTFTESQLRADVLYAMEEEKTLSINGKRRKVPLILVIYQQLLIKGAAGDVRCIFKAIDLRQQLLTEHAAAMNEYAEVAVRTKRAQRAKPGDFTDVELDAAREAHRRAKDPYHVDWPATKGRTRKQ